jgi:hypothetical protein
VKAGNGWRPYKAVKAERGHEGRDKAGMRPLGPNGATETRLWRPRRGHGGRDKAVEVGMRPLRPNKAAKAKRGSLRPNVAVEVGIRP